MYTLEFDTPSICSSKDITPDTIADPLVREGTKLIFQTNYLGPIKRAKYEPTLFFDIENGKMEGTVPDLFIELYEGKPIRLEMTGLLWPMFGDMRVDPKAKQKRIMAKEKDIDYRVWYGQDFLRFQRLFKGYGFTLTNVWRNVPYVKALSL